MRAINRLTALKVTRLKRPGLYGDGGGLCLQVQDGPTKSWIFRYMLAGRPRKMGIGPLTLVPLAEARDKALACRKLLLAGVDPIEARAAERAKAAAEALHSITFDECAEQYIAAHRQGWRNATHAKQWMTTLASYASPIIGALPVRAIDLAAVMKVLEQKVPDKTNKKLKRPLWETQTDTAKRLRGRIESVLNWATVRGYRSGDNPARWRGHLDQLLASPAKIAKVTHHAALPYDELPAFMAALRERDGISARALEFTILTASRTGEVIGARRDEFNNKERMWTIPGDRTKSGREHRVPISDRAAEIIAALPSEGEFVFPGRWPGSPLSNMALLATLRKMGRGDLTTHGFRSTFRDWGAEQTAYPHEVLEMALAHIVSDKVEAAYRRGDLLEKRHRLMADFAAFCASHRGRGGAKVVPLRAP